jgi:Fic family protein
MDSARAWIWEHTDWPAFRWREREISPALARARLAQGRILGTVDLLDPALTLDADVSILVEDGVQTSAIEGERLGFDAVRSSAARHLGLPTAGLPVPSRAIDGLIDVLLDATRRFDAPLTLERLLGWQAALFPGGSSGLRTIRSGQLRGAEPMEVVSGGIGGERVHFLAPPRERLEAELARFFDWFEAPPEDLDGLVRAGLAHLWLITLHPFEDGNGRLARAVTDMAAE